ncbi:hypothetical protein KSP39_PZI016149 [Platanthera zijinensis]|uniref:Uncharacterized protein n=1 Tax=Platanthera zijinensis TaxID=2320716 RepID=A0AAP0B6H0_9ASPA
MDLHLRVLSTPIAQTNHSPTSETINILLPQAKQTYNSESSNSYNSEPRLVSYHRSSQRSYLRHKPYLRSFRGPYTSEKCARSRSLCGMKKMASSQTEATEALHALDHKKCKLTAADLQDFIEKYIED